MFIVKETDESKINKATELVSKRSKQLTDIVEDILALKGAEENED